MNILLQQARIIDPVTARDDVADILIENGIISKIGSRLDIKGQVQKIDMNGKIVTPGFIDMHVHLREPGFEYKETIESGCAAAAAGGFTAVCCMPNTHPVMDNAEVVKYVKTKAAEALNGLVDVYPIPAITKGREGKELSPIAELIESGAVGFSDDGSPVESSAMMRLALEYAGMFGAPIIQHPQDMSLTKGGVMNEGATSTAIGMPAMSPVAEDIMVARDLILVEYIKTRYHIAHISTKGSIELVRQAKRKGLPVTCEVTPHHFTLTEESVRSFDTNTKMNPPLRTKEDIDAIFEGLRDGTIDAIATDHAPHSYDEKEVEYINAPFGIVGLETAVGLAISQLIEKKILNWMQLIEKFSTAPRRLLRLPEIKIAEKSPANLTLLDPQKEWTVDPNLFKSKSKNTPFGGWKLKGKAVGIINHGMIRMQ
jgi:dihydroorotase